MEYKKIEEFTTVVTGGTPSTGKREYWDRGNIPWLQSGCCQNCDVDSTEKYITQEGYDNSSTRIMPPNTVMIALTGATAGKVGYLNFEACGNQSITGIFPCDLMNQRYLFYYLISQRDKILADCVGGAQAHISQGYVKNIKVPILPLLEQQQIVEVLTKLSNIISMRQKEINALDGLIKARFVEMFGDPKINDKGWDSGIISEYFDVKGGKRIPKGKGYADGITAHPYLRATDMKNGTILDDDIHYIDEEVFEYIKRYTVQGGDIYLTNVGVNLGMAGVIPDKYDGANLTENAVKLVPKTEKVIDGLFLAHYINSPGIQNYINERKMSVGVPKLAIFRIETMPLLLPHMELQTEFIEFCKQVDKSKVVVQKALKETQTLFNSLMQEYFG